jgi:hypothetical protein
VGPPRRIRRGIVVTFILALTLSACASPRVTSKGESTSTSTLSPPSSTTTTEGASSTTPTVVDATECVASDLRPSWDSQGDGAAGTIYYNVNLANVSGASCTTGGYFGVSAYDPSGTLLASQDIREPMGAPAEVTVSPGGSISFAVGFVDQSSTGGGTPCTSTVGALHLIPPNTTTEVQIATPLPAAASTVGYPSLCEPRIAVGPVQSGIAPA